LITSTTTPIQGREINEIGDTVNTKSISIVVWIAFFLVPQTSLAAQKGSLKSNPEMTQALRDGRPPADFIYWTTGKGSAPDAVIGLDPQWKQTARLWRNIGPASEEVNKLIKGTMPYFEREPEASDIVTPDGEVIGVYWSSIHHVPVEMGAGNTVKVFKPQSNNRD